MAEFENENINEPVVQPATGQSNNQKLEIPPELLKGLESIEAGAFPTMITRRLEFFLTELGLYNTSMTPEEAWKTLQQVAKTAPTASRITRSETAFQSPVSPPAEPVPEANAGGLTARIRRKKKGGNS